MLIRSLFSLLPPRRHVCRTHSAPHALPTPKRSCTARDPPPAPQTLHVNHLALTIAHRNVCQSRINLQHQKLTHPSAPSDQRKNRQEMVIWFVCVSSLALGSTQSSVRCLGCAQQRTRTVLRTCSQFWSLTLHPGLFVGFLKIAIVIVLQ